MAVKTAHFLCDRSVLGHLCCLHNAQIILNWTAPLLCLTIQSFCFPIIEGLRYSKCRLHWHVTTVCYNTHHPSDSGWATIASNYSCRQLMIYSMCVYTDLRTEMHDPCAYCAGINKFVYFTVIMLGQVLKQWRRYIMRYKELLRTVMQPTWRSFLLCIPFVKVTYWAYHRIWLLSTCAYRGNSSNLCLKWGLLKNQILR